MRKRETSKMWMIVFVQLAFTIVVVGIEDTGFDYNCPYQGCECIRDFIGCGAQNWKTFPELLTPHVDGQPSLDLEGNALTTVPVGSLPSGLSGINFDHNPISTIDDYAFDGSSDTLKFLTFTNASFTELPNALSHLNALSSLTIRYTLIQDWNINALKHIGLTLQSLKLDSVGLLSWPTWFDSFLHLQVLDFTSLITTIPDNAFDKQTHTLTSLKLDNGLLSEIPFAVSQIASLNGLYMDYNRISRISDLPNFGNLSSLSLINNNLSDARHLSDKLRSVSDSLTLLQLQGNHLTAFPDLSFMKKLDSVYLTQNRIHDTSSGSISPSVIYLEFNSNNLRSLSHFLIGGVNLKTLSINMNFITYISGVDIPYSVQELYLQNNQITELTDTSFPQNSTMNTLVLDYNPISKISTLAFAGLRYLRYISLKITKLTRLPLALISLTVLDILDLSQNARLVCTCLEKPLRSWSLARGLTIFGDCGETSIENFLDILSVDCHD